MGYTIRPDLSSSALPPQPPPKESFARRYKFEVSLAYTFGCQPCCWRLVKLLEDIMDGNRILIFMNTKEGCDQESYYDYNRCCSLWFGNGDKTLMLVQKLDRNSFLVQEIVLM
nr:dead-box atp-dependent rna helicase 20 [Quercus suber]